MSINGRRKEILPFDTEGYSEFRHRAACLAPDEWTARGTVLVKPENNILRSQLRDPSKRNNYFDVLKMAEAEVAAYAPYLTWFQLCEENCRGEIEIPQRQLRLCPECQSEELEHDGRAFLKPEHQLPLATVCTIHNCGLIRVATIEETRNPLDYADLMTSLSLESFHGLRLDLSLNLHSKHPQFPASSMSILVNQLLQNDDCLAQSASQKLGWGEDCEGARNRLFGVLFLLTRPDRARLSCAVNEFWSPEGGLNLVSGHLEYPAPEFEHIAQKSMNLLLDIAGSLSCTNNVKLQHRLKRSRFRVCSEYVSMSSESNYSALRDRLNLIAIHMRKIDAAPNFEIIERYFPEMLDDWLSAWEATRSFIEGEYGPVEKPRRASRVIQRTH